MNILFTRIFCIAAMMFGIMPSAHGADTLNVANSRLYFDNIPIINIWANSSNPAGLAFLNASQINLVETGYTFNNKELKSPIEPGITNIFYAITKGYKKIGKLTFFGSFGYNNEQYRKLFYNNTFIFDINNPYLLGDTIGGRQKKEGFLLKGSVAYPVTGKITIGIDADYQNYVGAKIKDPRNRNDISFLAITPGLIYNGSKISVGISGGPIIYNNDISVSVMDESKYNLFQFLGFGYYKSILNIVDYSNAYYGKGYQAETQFRYRQDNYSNFLVIKYNSYSEEVRYGNTKRLIDGISDKTGISFSNYQSFRKNENLHQLNIFLNMMNISGTEVMQHFKNIVAGLYTYDTLITDSWIEGKHAVSNYDGTMEYLITGYNNDLEKFRMNFGLSAEYQTVYHYPVQNYGFQKVFNIMVFSGYKRFKTFKSLTFVPGIGLAYRKNLYKGMNYVVTDKSIPELQKQDYMARYSDFVRGNASISFMKRANSKFFSEYFLKLDASYTYAPDKVKGPFRNFFFNTSIGLIF